MGIVEAIARVKQGVRQGGLPAVMAELGEQLRSDVIPAPLRPAAVRLAALLRSAEQPGKRGDVVSLHDLAAHADAHASRGVCPVSGVRSDGLVAQAFAVPSDDVAAHAEPARDVAAPGDVTVECAAVPAIEVTLDATLASLEAELASVAEPVVAEPVVAEPVVAEPVAAELEAPASVAVESVVAEAAAVEAPAAAAPAVQLELATEVAAPATAPSRPAASRRAPAARAPRVAQPVVAKSNPAAAKKDQGDGQEKLASRSPSAKSATRPNAKPSPRRPSAKAGKKK